MAFNRYRHKYNAVRTERDGFKFDSKKEAKYYDDLKLLQQSGELLFFIRQVPFHLPGNVRYVLDFVEFYKNGDVRFVAVKGMITPTYSMKKKLVEASYPIKIEEV